MKHYLLLVSLSAFIIGTAIAQSTQKPPLHGKHWMAITGKPLAATAGAMVFQRGGNAVDDTCAILAATCTMWDVLSWGGETQALIHNPETGKIIAINALGVAPTGATPVTPGGLCYMLAKYYGKLSLKEVIAPAMEMAAGYPIDAQTANSMERGKDRMPRAGSILVNQATSQEVVDQWGNHGLSCAAST